ncbi:MAG: FHA domain-containing protein [Acidobacteria bacterium]|nr:FHA domain-containing protein [Acidobacteriota bacterium]
MAKLLVQESGAEPREFDLVDAEVHIGRELDNALRIPDPSISRHHCVIRQVGTGYEIQDLQSSNGVLVNGNRVQSSPLKHGDRVTLGQIQITFQDPQAAGADEGATVAIQAIGSENPAGTVRMSADQMAAVKAGIEPKAAPATPAAPSVPPVAPKPPQAPQFGHFTDPGQSPNQGALMSDAPAPTSGQPFADEDKIHLFLAYFGLLSLVPYLMFKDKRDDPQKEFVYWHARQGLALSITVIICWIPIFILAFIPILGCIVMVLGWLFLLVVGLGGSIMGWIKAFGGQKWAFPVISKFAGMLG